eukprot:7387707-Prymnesium_polylepis.1
MSAVGVLLQEAGTMGSAASVHSTPTSMPASVVDASNKSLGNRSESEARTSSGADSASSGEPESDDNSVNPDVPLRSWRRTAGLESPERRNVMSKLQRVRHSKAQQNSVGKRQGGPPRAGRVAREAAVATAPQADMEDNSEAERLRIHAAALQAQVVELEAAVARGAAATAVAGAAEAFADVTTLRYACAAAEAEAQAVGARVVVLEAEMAERQERHSRAERRAEAAEVECENLKREAARLRAQLIHAEEAAEDVATRPNAFMQQLKAEQANVRQKAREAAKQEGLEEGRQEGRTEGRTEGAAEGRAEGWAEGHAEGLAEGRAEHMGANAALEVAVAASDELRATCEELRAQLEAAVHSRITHTAPPERDTEPLLLTTTSQPGRSRSTADLSDAEREGQRQAKEFLNSQVRVVESDVAVPASVPLSNVEASIMQLQAAAPASATAGPSSPDVPKAKRVSRVFSRRKSSPALLGRTSATRRLSMLSLPRSLGRRRASSVEQ